VTEQHSSADAVEEVVGSAAAGPTAEAESVAEQDAVAGQAPAGETVTGETVTGDAAAAASTPAGGVPVQLPAPGAEQLAAERLSDLQRLQAEYVNYKRRVDRDRAVVQERAAQSVIEALLPVLDDIHAAREHGDLEGGPFAAIADKLESTLGKFGLERYGAVGEEFDPTLHEALMHTAWPQDGSVGSTGSTTVVQVLQPGYRAGEQVLRAARVAVADPE
jgi:molecular chaperone GrpE